MIAPRCPCGAAGGRDTCSACADDCPAAGHDGHVCVGGAHECACGRHSAVDTEGFRRWLAKKGCSRELSMYVPQRIERLARDNALSIESIDQVYQHRRRSYRGAMRNALYRYQEYLKSIDAVTQCR